MSVHDEQRRKAKIRKIVAGARAIVTYQVGLPHGCVRLRRLLYRFEIEYPVFEEYLAELEELPIGTERLYWAQDALRVRDEKLEKINRDFRNRIFDTCFEIIKSFGGRPMDTKQKTD
jgi:hypothetical protein